MKLLDDGSMFLEAGERMPYICPDCRHPHPFDDKLERVECSKCHYIGTPDEFSEGEFELVKVN